jgi:hypothetical protein
MEDKYKRIVGVAVIMQRQEAMQQPQKKRSMIEREKGIV